MQRLRGALILTLALALPAPAALAADPAGAELEDHSAWVVAAQLAQRQALERLGERDPARQLLLSALLAPFLSASVDKAGAEADPGDSPAARLARAAELAPDDILIAWAQTRCATPESGPACDFESAHARLKRLDPDNAYVQLLALNATTDEAVRRAALSRAAKATRFDNYLNAVGALLLDFALDVEWPQPAPPGVSPDVTAVGHLAAVAMPAYGSLMNLCLPARKPTTDAALRNDCIAVLEHMRAWPQASSLDGMIALSALSRLALQADERARWAADLRGLRWAQQQAVPLLNGLEPEASRAYIRSWFADGEIKAMYALLEREQVALSPPPDWQADGDDDD